MTDTNPTPETDPKREAEDHLAARIAAATERAAAQHGAAGREAVDRTIAEQMAAARALAERAMSEREATDRASAELAEAARAEAARVEAERVEAARIEAERAASEHEALAHIKEAMTTSATEPEPAANVEPVAAKLPPPAEPVPAASKPMPVPPAPPQPAPVMRPAERRSGTPVWLTVLIAVLLGGGIYYVWQDRSSETASAGGAETQRVAALEAALKAAQDHITALENRPAPSGAADATRIAALETALRALQAKPAATVDTSALEARIATLEQRKVPDTDSIVASVSAGLTAKIAALDAQVQKDAALTAARAAATAKLRGATTALETGKPLGAIPDAPPALARFATTAPPTEPALRLSFSKYAEAAEAASKPSAEGHDFAERMWMRAQTLVTVRQGDHVLVGAPAAVTLEAARGKLDAGDLAGAVAALAPLDPAATAAMKPWRDEAQALLDARSALAALAAKS